MVVSAVSPTSSINCFRYWMCTKTNMKTHKYQKNEKTGKDNAFEHQNQEMAKDYLRSLLFDNGMNWLRVELRKSDPQHHMIQF